MTHAKHFHEHVEKKGDHTGMISPPNLQLPSIGRRNIGQGQRTAFGAVVEKELVLAVHPSLEQGGIVFFRSARRREPCNRFKGAGSRFPGACQTMNDSVFGALGFLSFFWTLAYFCFRYWFSRTGPMLQRWAKEYGYILLRKKYCWFGSPFWFRGSDQYVFEIQVLLPEGTKREGYALCGHWLLGLWRDDVRVKWK